MANIIKKVKNRIRLWFGYHNGIVNVYTGRSFAQGPGFNVNVDTFEIRRLGIRFIKSVTVDADPMWFETLKKRLAEDKK